jgi:hypothetical protein
MRRLPGKRTKGILFFLLLITAAGSVLAQSASFTASLNAREVIQGNTFQIAFTLKDADGNNFRPPSFRDFAVVGSRGVSSSMTFINGKSSRSTTYTYTLQAKRTGSFEIGPATVEADGKNMSSNPVRIKVVKGNPASQKKNEDATASTSGEVFIRAVPAKDTAFVGEQILLDYKLYTTLDVQNYSLVQESSYPGFFAQNVRYFDSGVMQEVLDGTQYTTKVLKRVALFAQQQGTLTIDPMIMTVGVGIRRSLFSRLPGQYLNISSLPVNIEVQPLPADAPLSFSGAVGSYDIRPGDLNGQIASGEALTLQFLVSGFGDNKRLQAPFLQFPNTFEVYEPKVISERTFEQDGKIAGEKLFEWVVVPEAAGSYRIPWSFAVFEPDSARYRIIRSDTLSFFVSQGKAGRQSSLPGDQISSGDELHPIELDPKLRETHSLRLFSNPLFWVLSLLPLGLLLGGLFLQADKMSFSLTARNKKPTSDSDVLQAAAEHLNDHNPRLFYDKLSRGLMNFASRKIHQPLQSLNRYELEKRLKKEGWPDEKIQTLSYLLNACDLALFGGSTHQFSREELYHKAKELVDG